MYKKDDRVMLLRMGNDPHPIESGTTGTVTYYSSDAFGPGRSQIGVRWDNGRTLAVILPEDAITKIDDKPKAKAKPRKKKA